MSRRIKDESFTSIINEDLSVFNDTILMSNSILESIIQAPHPKARIKEFTYDFMEYVFEKAGLQLLSFPSNYLTIIFDEDFNSKLTISYRGFIFNFLKLLNCPMQPFDNQKFIEKLEQYSSINSEYALKKDFPYSYKIYQEMKDYVRSNRMFMLEYQMARNDATKYRKFKKNYGLSSVSDEIIDKQYNTFKMFTDINLYIEETTNFFCGVANGIPDIKKWISDNSLDLQLSHSDTKRIFLYTIFLQMETLRINAKKGYKAESQITFTTIEKMIKQYISRYPKDETKIELRYNETIEINNIKENADVSPYAHVDSVNKKNRIVTYSLKDAFEDLEKIKIDYPYLKSDVILPEIDRSMTYNENLNNRFNYIKDLLNTIINEDKENGAKDATDEINKKVEQLEKDLLDSNTTEENRNLKKLILNKIKMVLKDIEPKAIQKNEGGVFRNYYVYYYPNGMVALDKLDGYGALYIMPVHIYKEARYKKLLTDVKNIPGVISINHKNKNWLEIAKNSIENGIEGLTEEDIKKSEEVASIVFPYTIDKLEELEKQFLSEGNEKGVEEAKRRIIKTKQLEDIDKDLKNSEREDYSNYPANKREKVEQFDGEKDDTLNSDDIQEVVSSNKSFEELYELWKKKDKPKTSRNPVVAGITKRRSMNEKGNYCCEMCGDEYIDTRPLRSHHVIPLCKGGIDNIYNTVCICPNCHDFVHSHEMTIDVQASLFEIIKNHLIEENPEYLPKFLDMISPIAKSKEDYEARKEILDSNFYIQWKDSNINKR